MLFINVNTGNQVWAVTFVNIIAIGLVACASGEAPGPSKDQIIGDSPAISGHTSQQQINEGKLPLEEIVRRGEMLFTASFNTLDGAGRPETADIDRKNNISIINTRPRHEFPDNFNRISGPDANTCLECHTLPRMGGGGGNSTNVFVLADRLAFANFDGGPGDNNQTHTLRTVGDERNSLGMFGSGWIELLAREMTVDLKSAAEEAINEAKRTRGNVAKDLVTKGISFGRITARPDATLDFSELEGVDNDLVIRPFQQKGVIVSLREFTVKAMNSHFGIQASEQFRDGVDFDRDGYFDELTRGDVTALVLFQAILPAPGQVLPDNPEARTAVKNGRELFSTVGCGVCHVPELRVNNPIFSEPSPFNPRGKLQPSDVNNPFKVDLTMAGPGPHLKREPDGSVLVPVFTDLKRHKMGSLLNNETLVQDGVPTDEWLTRKLWGFASEPPFLHHGRATLISEAILAHGGEAQISRDRFNALTDKQKDSVVEFLKTLQILPAEANTTTKPEKHHTGTDAGFMVIIGGLVWLILLMLACGIIVILRRR